MKNLSDENLYNSLNEYHKYHKDSNLKERKINKKRETYSKTIIPNTQSNIDKKEKTNEIIVDYSNNGNKII